MSEKIYKTTKEECEKQIHGVCEGCGGKLEPIETVDNSNNPTFWVGCTHCMCFRSGVEEKYFKIARRLVEDEDIIRYNHMKKSDYDTPESLDYYLCSQTVPVSYVVAKIDKLLKEST
jgi:hypothetical protein